MRSTGTPKGIFTWYRQQSPDTSSLFELLSKAGFEGLEPVCSWEVNAVGEDVNAWAELVIAAAQEDAEGRGSTTRYLLRHTRANSVRGTMNITRVVSTDANGEVRAEFDGSSQSLVNKLLQSTERAHSQVIEMSKASLDTQKAAMSLLGQSYAMLAKVQMENAELREQLNEAGAVASKGTNGKPDVFRTMMETVGPTVGAHVAEQVLPILLAAAQKASAA